VSSKVLAVVAHADDEVLGCGGTLMRHAAEGDYVRLAIFADGVTSRHRSYDADKSADEIKSRESAARQAANIMGVEEPVFLRFPDNRCDQVATLDLAKAVETLIVDFQPDTIYTHHAGDLNVDHRHVFHAVLTACRPLPATSVRNIYSMEIPSSTEWGCWHEGNGFRPQRFVDIARFFEAKLHALSAYSLEMRSFPHPRSPEAVEALAKLRGATGGLTAAEAFMVIREVI